MNHELQVLVAAVGQDIRQLAARMNLQSDAIVINQGDSFRHEEFAISGGMVKGYHFAERGVGLSRNNALMRATADVVLFADEDIVYDEGYAGVIAAEFAAHPEADVILFNIAVDESRATYANTAFKRVRWYNYGRFGAVSIAARTERLHGANVTFSLLFGGGARYASGEDSLFLRDCLRGGLRLYASPRSLGGETCRESTWFSGYNEKFFYDRGVTYWFLYGNLARLLALRFVWVKRAKFCREIPWRKAHRLMRDGISHAMAKNG